MNQTDKKQQNQRPGKRHEEINNENQYPQSGGQPNRDRSSADDRGEQGISNRPDDQEQGIPELEEPDVEGVGNEGRRKGSGQPDPTGTNPNRGNR
jgi:hypothetical protein